MKLYLMQHGEAMAQTENPERPLTERGKKDIARMAAFLTRLGVHLHEIRHSGKKRAEETAKIVAQYLYAQERVVAEKGLNPNDDVRPVATLLQQETLPIMLVGHLPFLSRLTSVLLTGDPERTLVQFHTGGVICLERQEEPWILQWMVIPEII